MGLAIRSVQRELHNLSYVESKNIMFEYRYAEDKSERSVALADELVRLKVDVIVAAGTGDTLAAKNADGNDAHRVFGVRVASC